MNAGENPTGKTDMVYRFVICRADALFVVDRENRGDDNRTRTAVAGCPSSKEERE